MKHAPWVNWAAGAVLVWIGAGDAVPVRLAAMHRWGFRSREIDFSALLVFGRVPSRVLSLEM